MRTLALLDGNAVTNIIIGDPSHWPGAIDITDMDPRPGPGWTYDGVAFTPAAPAAPAPKAVIPRDDFIERFTPAEWIDGKQRAQADANLALGLDLLMGKQDGMVNLASPRVTDLFAYMIAIGMLTPVRAADITRIA